jgi:hypothetical protein
MARRLALNTAGIKSPLDVGDVASPATTPAPTTRPVTPERRPAASRVLEPATQPVPDPSAAQARSKHTPPFFGGGRGLQTSIALDTPRAELLAELSRATSLSMNAIAVAAIHAGLPTSTDAARELILAERVDRAGARKPRLETNLRLPLQLRTRVDELTAGARELLPRSERADLINATLGRGLPHQAEAAAELVAEHTRQLELAGGR